MSITTQNISSYLNNIVGYCMHVYLLE